MSEKFDFKKEFKEFYLPKAKPVLVEVPAMNFIMIDGEGAPSEAAYSNAISVLYAIAYKISMSKKGGVSIKDFFEFVVPPLEGLWWISKGEFSLTERDNWLWTAMIRQPDFVNEEVVYWAASETRSKKTELDLKGLRLETFAEGLCVQMLHVGPYATEPASVEIMHEFMKENQLLDETGNLRKHHEIYLSDPRKTPPEKLKTVLRHPVRYNL